MLLTESTGRSALGADQIPDMVTSDLTARAVAVAGTQVAREEFDELLPMSAGIEGHVSRTLTLSATVGARQRLKAFGKGNSQLEGAAVNQSGSVRVVTAKSTLDVELSPDLKPTNE